MMNNDYKFGVCKVVDIDKELYEDMKIFDTYEDASKEYFRRLLDNTDNLYIDKHIWIVWIRKRDNMIIQFDQLQRHTKLNLKAFENLK